MNHCLLFISLLLLLVGACAPREAKVENGVPAVQPPAQPVVKAPPAEPAKQPTSETPVSPKVEPAALQPVAPGEPTPVVVQADKGADNLPHTAPAAKPQPQPAQALRVSCGEQDYPLAGLDLRVSDRLAFRLHLPTVGYWEIYGDKTLKDACLIKQKPGNACTHAVNLSRMTSDSNWFLLHSANELSDAERDAALTAIDARELDAGTLALRGTKKQELLFTQDVATWRFHLVETVAGDWRVQSLGTMYVYHVPFELVMKLKKKDQQQFVPVSMGVSVQQDDRLQLQVTPVDPAHPAEVAIFLCDSERNVTTYYPADPAVTCKLTCAEYLPSPATGEAFDDKVGAEYVVCFYDYRQLPPLANLEAWLKNPAVDLALYYLDYYCAQQTASRKPYLQPTSPPQENTDVEVKTPATARPAEPPAKFTIWILHHSGEH